MFLARKIVISLRLKRKRVYVDTLVPRYIVGWKLRKEKNEDTIRFLYEGFNGGVE